MLPREGNTTHNGFVFIYEKAFNGRKYWKCEQYQKFKCPARVIVTYDGQQIFKKEHNHTGNSAKVEAAKVVNEIKNR